MDLLVFIPNRIEDLLRKKRMTAYALAMKTRIDQSIFSNIKKKGRIPTLETLNRICDGLGVTISRFSLKNLIIHSWQTIRFEY